MWLVVYFLYDHKDKSNKEIKLITIYKLTYVFPRKQNLSHVKEVKMKESCLKAPLY